MVKTHLFSDQLEMWLKSDKPKTIAELETVFGERTFAVLFLLFMALPALPIPTGGITHIFEIITMIVSLGLVAGRTKIWIPKFLSRRALPKSLIKKLLPLMMRRVRWFEKHSSHRGAGLIKSRWFRSFAGLCVFGATLGAFLAPAFSGLDTLPSLGVVSMAIGMIVGDMILFFAGTLVGALGTILEITVGAALYVGLKKLLKHVTGTELWWVSVIALVVVLAAVICAIKRHKKA